MVVKERACVEEVGRGMQGYIGMLEWRLLENLFRPHFARASECA